MQTLILIVISALAVYITGVILPGVKMESFLTAIGVALVLGIINTFLRPLLILLTLPINILTLGLFTFVINATMVLLADAIVPGFSVANFWWALLFSIVLTLVGSMLFSLV